MKFKNYLEEIQSKKWIKGAIKHPGALRKKLKKKEDEKISQSDISAEKKKIEKGGLTAAEKKEEKQLNLAKTLIKMKKSKKQ